MGHDELAWRHSDATTEHLASLFEAEEHTDPRPGRRRRRWPWVLLSVVVTLSVLAVSAELLARIAIPSVVRGIVVAQLRLPADQQLDVETEGFLLPQLLAGRLDELRLSSDSITINGITGAAEITARGLSPAADHLDSANATVRMDQEQFGSLLAADGDLPVDSVAFDGSDIVTSGTVSVLGFDVPLSLTVTPGAEDGYLTLTPVRLSLAGAEVDSEQIVARLGGLGSRLTQTQRVCVASWLPAAVTLTGVRIDGAYAVIDAVVDGDIVTNRSLRQRGACG